VRACYAVSVQSLPIAAPRLERRVISVEDGSTNRVGAAVVFSHDGFIVKLPKHKGCDHGHREDGTVIG
jgi:hypothetical protein